MNLARLNALPKIRKARRMRHTTVVQNRGGRNLRGAQRPIFLGKGKHSRAMLSYFLLKTKKVKNETGKEREVYFRIIAGTPVRGFLPKENRWIEAGGIGGSRGILELTVYHHGNGNKIDAEVCREVPKKYRQTGLGADLLIAAETVAKKIGAGKIFAYTSNANVPALNSYSKAGWSSAGNVTDSAGNKLVRFEKKLGR